MPPVLSNPDYWPLYAIGAFAALLTVLPSGWLAVRLGRKVKRLLHRRRHQFKPEPRIGLIRALLAITASSLGLAILSLDFALLWHFYEYQVLTAKELIAQIDTVSEKGPQAFEILYTPIRRGQPLPPERFALAGDQWRLGADILKWHPFMNYLGFQTFYKITRLDGRYLRAADEETKKRIVHTLNGGTDADWIGLYGKCNVWPYRWFIEGVYGQDIYQFPEPGVVFKVHLTSSGLSLTKEAKP